MQIRPLKICPPNVTGSQYGGACDDAGPTRKCVALTVDVYQLSPLKLASNILTMSVFNPVPRPSDVSGPDGCEIENDSPTAELLATRCDNGNVCGLQVVTRFA
jgi:hypothetical protein